jgi:glycosyltransferase involved in cell wall biosynthesis
VNNQVTFSLVLCTLGRNSHVINFLETVSKQEDVSFEVILVDQNDNNNLEMIIKEFQNLKIKYLKSKKGLSIGRNVGLQHVEGEYVSFPDDDCEYPENLLINILNFFKDNNYDFLTCCSRWKDGNISNGNFDRINGEITKYNVWSRAISYTLFIKKESIGNILFDENLGVGSKSIFQSGEETDFVLNVLNNKKSGFYIQSLFVYHPHVTDNYNDLKNRIKRYTPGKCYVLKKHNYNLLYILLFMFLPLIKFVGNIFFFNTKNANIEFLKFKIRLLGFYKS